MALIENCDVEKLISAVQCRRPIYDNSAKEHGSRGLLEHLWNEIAEEMNAPVNKCKAKWQQLRNSFVRSYRGTSGFGKKRKKWYLHDNLSFMEEYIHLQKLDDVVYSDDQSLHEYEIEEKTGLQQSATNFEEPIVYSSTYFQHSPLETTAATVATSVENLQRSSREHNISLQNSNCESQDIPMPPKLQPIPQMQTIPPKYMNIPNSTSTATTITSNTAATNTNISQPYIDTDNPLLNFCKGLLPEFDRLTAERQRRFKTEILIYLNRHMDEQEKEQITPDCNYNNNHDRFCSRNYIKRSYSKNDELSSNSHNIRFKSE